MITPIQLGFSVQHILALQYSEGSSNTATVFSEVQSTAFVPLAGFIAHAFVWYYHVRTRSSFVQRTGLGLSRHCIYEFLICGLLMAFDRYFQNIGDLVLRHIRLRFCNNAWKWLFFYLDYVCFTCRY